MARTRPPGPRRPTLDNAGSPLTPWSCKYPDELRERAVREVRTTGRPIAHVAKDLGIHKEALRGWVRQAEADAGERDDRLTTAEHEELKQLRKEVAELRRANEILKAASAFFAAELDRPRTRPTR
ncbi:transposase [Streptomyces sp. NPDC003996]